MQLHSVLKGQRRDSEVRVRVTRRRWAISCWSSALKYSAASNKKEDVTGESHTANTAHQTIVSVEIKYQRIVIKCVFKLKRKTTSRHSRSASDMSAVTKSFHMYNVCRTVDNWILKWTASMDVSGKRLLGRRDQRKFAYFMWFDRDL